MPIIGLIILGAAAGFIATRLMKTDTDLITTIVIGILGALAAGTVLRVLLTLTGWAAGFVGAVLGAMALIWIWQTYIKRR
jgi:uncharacterized membrane protein YeaQ/YmgE (transglycosylase-associated protein family)